MGPILRKYDPWSQDQGLQVFAEVVLTAVKTTWQKHLFASFCRQKWQKLKKVTNFHFCLLKTNYLVTKVTKSMSFLKNDMFLANMSLPSTARNKK